jgi:hypothetical protein
VVKIFVIAFVSKSKKIISDFEAGSTPEGL